MMFVYSKKNNSFNGGFGIQDVHMAIKLCGCIGGVGGANGNYVIACVLHVAKPRT